jgi:hypothetical protein
MFVSHVFEQPGGKLFTSTQNLLSHAKGTGFKIFERTFYRKIINYTLGFEINNKNREHDSNTQKDYLNFWHRRFIFNSNKLTTRCKKFSVYYPEVCLQLNRFRAFSRPSSGAQ